jgi:hypothetical protein
MYKIWRAFKNRFVSKEILKLLRQQQGFEQKNARSASILSNFRFVPFPPAFPESLRAHYYFALHFSSLISLGFTVVFRRK